MIDEIKKIKKAVETIRMSDIETTRVKNYLHTYISSAANSAEAFIPSPYSFFSFIKNGKIIAGVLAFLVIISASTSFAAAQALPGETLYPIKVNVNEELQSIVTFGTDAKAELALSRAKSRLQEAEELSVQGKLNPETQEIIVSNFNKHAADLQNQTKVLASANEKVAAQNLSNQLETSVKAHAQILKVVAGGSPSQVASADSFVKEVESTVGTSSLSASSSKLSTSSTTSNVTQKMEEAAKQIASSKEFIDSSKITLIVQRKINLSLEAADAYFNDAATLLSATSSLNSTSTKIIKASTLLKKANQAKAFNLFLQAESKAAEAQTLAEIYVHGGVNAEQVINSIPDSTLNPFPLQTIEKSVPATATTSTSTLTTLIATTTQASSTVIIATSTASTTLSLDSDK